MMMDARGLLLALVVVVSRPTGGSALRVGTAAQAPGTSRSGSPAATASVDPSTLAGDPSLVLNANVALSDKPAFLKAASAAVAAALSKPESYVAVCVTDSLDLLFGGTDDPCAVGCVYSIGAINQENNAVGRARSGMIQGPCSPNALLTTVVRRQTIYRCTNL